MLTAFYILSVLSILAALPLLFARNAVYCALSLVSTLLCTAGIFILLNNEFVAAIQVLIYAGAIMVLFLFVIMLLNLNQEQQQSQRFSIKKVIGMALGAAMLASFAAAFQSIWVHPSTEQTDWSGLVAEQGPVKAVGQVLFTEYVLHFEVIAVLLMVAVIGAILLAKRQAKQK